MRKFIGFIFLLSLLLSPVSVAADIAAPEPTISGTQASSPDTTSNSVICLPGVYLTQPADCTPAGPSLLLTSMAHLGMYYPERPLPSASPDPELSKMPATYVTASKESIPLFDSITAADAMSPSQTLGPGMKYLSIDQRLEQNHIIYYHLTSGAWVEGASAGTGCCIYAGRFQGLVFSRTPTSNFGWIIEETWSRVEPSFTAETSTHHYYRENIVAVYDTRQAGEYQMGHDRSE